MNPHLERALLLYQQSRYEMAETELRQALASDPDDAHAHAILALCLAEREEFESATQEAKQAIHLAPDHSFAHYALARVFLERNRFPEARAAIEEAIRLDPADADYFGTLASIYLNEERWPETLRAAEQGLQFDPEHQGCTNLRAMALVKLGRRAEAGATIDAALAKRPENSFTHANQGWTLLHKGDPKKALEHFREALRLDPSNEWAQHGIVEALKARNFIYAGMLKYFLWMARLNVRVRWGIILGGYFGSQLLSNVARANPAIAPWVWPLRITYICFALMTWLAYPLFNLMLRVNRFGRLALTREQTLESNIVGGSLLLCLIALTGWLLPIGNEAWFVAMVVFGLMMLPLSGIFRCDAGWPRWTMIAATSVLFLLGLGAIIMAALAMPERAEQKEFTIIAVAFIRMFGFGILISQFLVNFLAAQRVRR